MTAFKKLEPECGQPCRYLICYFLFGDKIHPNYDLIDNQSDKVRGELLGGIITHLTFKNLIEKVIERNVDVAAVVSNPTEEGLNAVLSLLELPKESLAHVFENSLSLLAKRKVSLTEIQLFTLFSRHEVTETDRARRRRAKRDERLKEELEEKAGENFHQHCS